MTVLPPDDGSRTLSKLDVASQELHNHLSKIQVGNDAEKNQQTSLFAIPKIEILHAAPISHISTTCCNTTNIGEGGNEDSSGVITFQEGEAYRCKCTFQICSSLPKTVDDDNNIRVCNGSDDFIYVTRENGTIHPLSGGIFPPANIRIRRAMVDFMNCINRRKRKEEKCNNMNVEDKGTYVLENLRRNLTSITFVTSWGDGLSQQSQPSSTISSNISPGEYGGDCLVTLHYGPPGLPKDDTMLLQSWKSEAKLICDQCHFTLLTGRSKGIKISVEGSSTCNHYESKDLVAAINEEGIIHDNLWLTMSKVSCNGGTRKDVIEVEKVSLVPPHTQIDDNNEHQQHICIQYQKPATAFQHPNSGVMLTSLHWILNVLSKIRPTAASDADATIKPRMLEMYCGCGAHTMPLAKSTLLSEIIAVELDERLVSACRNNCRLNNCLKSDDDDDDEHGVKSNQSTDDIRTLVQVFKGDASEWAAKTLRRQYKEQTSSNRGSSATDDDGYNNFDILLVDPPRDGLSSMVCDMAIKGTFTHVIYVSCGRRALLRDLTTLCSSDINGGFDVDHLAVIDLFPGTDAVETLVHLRRRRKFSV